MELNVTDATGSSGTGTVDALIERSNRLGADPKNTNYAGGNTSAKGVETDPVTGEGVELLWVKGSGGDLGTLTENGLAVLRLDRMREIASGRTAASRVGEVVAVHVIARPHQNADEVLPLGRAKAAKK